MCKAKTKILNENIFLHRGNVLVARVIKYIKKKNVPHVIPNVIIVRKKVTGRKFANPRKRIIAALRRVNLRVLYIKLKMIREPIRSLWQL